MNSRKDMDTGQEPFSSSRWIRNCFSYYNEWQSNPPHALCFFNDYSALKKHIFSVTDAALLVVLVHLNKPLSLSGLQLSFAPRCLCYRHCLYFKLCGVVGERCYFSKLSDLWFSISIGSCFTRWQFFYEWDLYGNVSCFLKKNVNMKVHP